MEINKHSATPLYAQVRALILKRIREGDYQPGTRIPSEMKLCQDLELSRPTVRQAIQGLVDSGYLVIKKGRGTYVVKEPEPTIFYNFNPGNFSILAKNEYYQDEFDMPEIIETNGNLDRIFNFAPNLSHPGFWSTHFVIPGNPENDDDSPVGFGTSYIPIRYFQDLANQFANNVPMAEIKAGKYNFLPASSQLYISTRPCTQQEGERLDVAERTSVMEMHAKLISKSKLTCEYLTLIFLAERVQFEIFPPGIKVEVPQN